MKIIAPILLVALIFTSACSTAPDTDTKKMALQDECEATISWFKSNAAGIDRFFDDSVGYAVFPSIGKGGIGIGGAYGRGMLYEGDRAVGYCDVSQGSIGFQLGGQAFKEIVFFQNNSALSAFKNGNAELSAGASAVAADAGAATAADYNNGVAVYVAANGGLMYEASVGGQKFSYEAK